MRHRMEAVYRAGMAVDVWPTRRNNVSRHFAVVEVFSSPVICHVSLGTESDQTKPSGSPMMCLVVPRTEESIVKRRTIQWYGDVQKVYNNFSYFFFLVQSGLCDGPRPWATQESQKSLVDHY